MGNPAVATPIRVQRAELAGGALQLFVGFQQEGDGLFGLGPKDDRPDALKSCRDQGGEQLSGALDDTQLHRRRKRQRDVGCLVLLGKAKFGELPEEFADRPVVVRRQVHQEILGGRHLPSLGFLPNRLLGTLGTMMKFISLPTEDLPLPSVSTIGVFQGASNFAELLQGFDELSAQQGKHLMLVFEEGDQMFYTASHAGEEHFELPENIDELDDLEEDDYERALAQDRRAQLADILPWEELAGALPLGDQAVDVIQQVNANLDLLVDPYHCVQSYDEPGALSWLADQPNGYFHGDLTPQQVLALSTRITETTPYRFLGMGGNFVGFRREAGDVDKPALMRDLAHIYGADLDLPCGEVLILPYTGTADQYLDRMS